MRLWPAGDQMRGGLARAFLVLRRDERRLEAGKTPHHLHDRHVARSAASTRSARCRSPATAPARRAVLAHRADDLQLAHRVLDRVGEKGNERAALAGVLGADRHFDEERVRQVVDDHAEHAGLARRARSPRRDGRCSRARPSPRRRARASPPRPGSLPPSTSETVDFETPARRATSTMVTRPSRPSASRSSAPSFIDRAIRFGTFQITNREIDRKNCQHNAASTEHIVGDFGTC